MIRPLSSGYRFARGIVRLLVQGFFREIVVEGVDRVPSGVGGLVVSWHPNGLIDPALILSHFPGKIVFGARHGLFEWPIVGWLIRKTGAIPFYRTQDLSKMTRSDAMKANQASLDAMSEELATGSFSALFPEGISHDEPHLTEIKTGAARLYYRARELAPSHGKPPVIIPVGLHYARKDVFRSRVLISFHDPIELPAHLDIDPEDDEKANVTRARFRELTELIEHTLMEVVRATEDWDLHHLMHRARKIMQAERAHRAGVQPEPPSMTEWDLGFARIWYGYRVRLKTHPGDIEKLRRDLRAYDKTIRAVRLEDFELTASSPTASPKWFGLLTLQFATVYLLLPPIIFAGYIINVIPYFLLKGLDRLLTHQNKDAATVKMLGGAVLFPLSWGIAAFFAAFASQELNEMYPTIPNVPVLVAAITILFAIVSGFLALRYNELSQETYRAVRVRITKKRHRNTIDRLVVERGRLFEDISNLEKGLDLPGDVAPDGRIVPKESL